MNISQEIHHESGRVTFYDEFHILWFYQKVKQIMMNDDVEQRRNLHKLIFPRFIVI